jgi:hypothetical protein
LEIEWTKVENFEYDADQKKKSLKTLKKETLILPSGVHSVFHEQTGV